MFLCVFVGPDPLAHEDPNNASHPQNYWDGNESNGTVEVDKSSLSIRRGQTGRYQLRLTKQPHGDNGNQNNWFVRIHADGDIRSAVSQREPYKGLSWTPSVGWNVDSDNTDVDEPTAWKSVTITVADDAVVGTRITFLHEVWEDDTDCPVHNVGRVVVTIVGDGGGNSPPPPPPPPPLSPPPDINSDDNGDDNGGGGNGSPNGDDNGGGGNGSPNGDGNGGGRDSGGSGDGNGGGRDSGGSGDGNGGGNGNNGNGSGGDGDRSGRGTGGDGDAPPPPPSISIGDATVYEGDTALFPVTLSATSRRTVTVRYRTEGGTAVAGADFEAASGTLIFEPGARRRSIGVRTLADDIEEPRENFKVTLSGPTEATLADATALGTITADVEGRVARANETILPEIGRAVAFTPVRCRIEQAFSHVSAGMVQSAASPSLSVSPVVGPRGSSGEASLSLEEALGSASFLLPLMSGDTGVARLAAWGCGDFRDLTGEIAGEIEGRPRTWDGGVSTMQLGIDAILDSDTLAGVALSRSRGAFDYSGAGGNGETDGGYDLRLTGIHPYFGISLSPDLQAWGTIGFADGRLQVGDDRAGDSLSSSATLLAGTLGLNGRLLTTDETTVTLKAEVGFARLDASSAAAAFRTASANLNLLRFAVEADYKYLIPYVGLLIPWTELGLRHDGGDGETGASLEVGGGLRYRNIEQGWNAEAYGRWLALRDDALPEEQGYGVRFLYDPESLGFGPWVSLAQTWGEPTSAVHRSWEDGIGDLGPHDPVRRRLDLEFGYGFPALRGQAALTPYSAVTLQNSDARGYRLGVRLTSSSSALLSLETERLERPAAPADHGVMLRAIARH